MASYLGGFRSTVNPYSNSMQNAMDSTHYGDGENLLSTIGNAVGGFVGNLRTVTSASARELSRQTSAPVYNPVTNKLQAPGQNVMAQPEVVAAGRSIGIDTTNPAMTGLGLAAAPVVAVGAAYDAGVRGINTAVGGTVFAAGDYLPQNVWARNAAGNNRFVNPLYRDGFQISDIPETFRRFWGEDQAMIGRNGLPVIGEDGKPVMEVNAPTAGQALSQYFGVSAINAADAVLPEDIQKKLDLTVEADNENAIADPLNERGLLSWMSGLHSQFNFFDMQDREAAYNQGLGRWISGSADAAIQWWGAPEVIGLKVAGFAGRSLFLKSINELSDIQAARTSIDLHRMWLAGEEGGQRTSFGSLLESLTKMNELQVTRHAIAKNSSDATLVGRTFGSSTSFEETADRFLAMSGDLQAIDRLYAKEPVLGDAMRIAAEQRAETQKTLDYWHTLAKMDDGPVVPFSFPGASPSLVEGAADSFYGNIVKQFEAQAERLDSVLKQATRENASLEAALAGFNREAGLPDVVSFGELKLSSLRYGPNSVARLESKALKDVDRIIGQHLWKTQEFKTGGTFGRTVRVWQSGYDYMKTFRVRGFANLNDPNDVMQEVDATLMTTPMMRDLQKQYGAETMLPGTNMLVTEFREQTYRELIAARTATERMGVVDKFQKTMWEALVANYGIDPEDAGRILEKYKGLRQVVVETAKARGFIPDNGEINIIPEMQALLAEGMPTMDFHYVETLFRLERGSGISRGKDWATLKGSRGLAAFDALWRPLVLMRLGYTARNVAEGSLRELAMFGTIGGWTQTNMGTRAIPGNFLARWAAGGGRQLDRISSLRYGSLRLARNNLEQTQGLATASLREVKALRAEQDRTAATLTAMADGAETKARRQLLLEARDEYRAKVAATWDEVTTEAYGDMDAIMQQAQEVIVPADLVRPIFGSGQRRSNTAAGFATPDEARLRQVQENEARANASRVPGQANPLDNLVPDNAYNTVSEDGAISDEKASRFLMAEERSQLDELTLAYESGVVEPWQEQLYGELIDRATARAVRAGMRNGDKVLRIVDPTQNLYQVVHNPAEIMPDDIASGLLTYLPKDNWNGIQYVRANVYGGVADLRIAGKPIPERDSTGLDGLLDRLGVDRFDEDDEANLEMLHHVLTLAQKDPAVADALRLRMIVKDAPQDLQDFLVERGLLLTNSKIRDLASKQARFGRAYTEVRNDREQKLDSLLNDLADPEYWKNIPEATWIPEGAMTHGGKEIPDDLISATPVDTSANTSNHFGVGLYVTNDVRQSRMFLYSASDTRRSGKPVFYVTMPEPGYESRFLDMYAPVMQGAARGASSDEIFQTQDELKQIYAHMLRAYWKQDWDTEGSAFLQRWENILSDIPRAMRYRNDGSTLGPSLQDVRRAMIMHFDDVMGNRGVDPNFGSYDAQMMWVNAVKDMGYDGLRVDVEGTWQGARNLVYYNPPEVRRVDSVTARAQEIYALNEQMDVFSRAQEVAIKQGSYLNRTVPWNGRSLNAAYMSEKNKAILAEYMKDRGIGRILIDDSYSPSGYQLLTSPDMMSVSTDQVDAVIPGRLVGRDFVDNKLDQVTQEAVVRNPSVLKTGSLSDTEILRMAGGDRAVLRALRDPELKADPATKAKIARMLELDGYSHAQIGSPDSNIFTNVSELVASKDAGAAYGATLGRSDVQQRANLILSQDDRFGKLVQDWESAESLLAKAEERLVRDLEASQTALGKLNKRLGKRATGAPMKATIGSGMERFVGNFDEFETFGPFNPNNQGSLNASLVSSGDTMLANLYGFTDYAMLALRKSQETIRFVPGQSHYFDALSEQLNKYYRNDLIGMAIIRNDSDEQIMAELFGTKQGRAYIRDVQGFGAFRGHIDASRLSDDARAELHQILTQRRADFNKLVPDEDLRAHLVDHEVTANYLQSQLGWRADLQDITGQQLIDNGRGIVRNFTGRVMNVLGTLPENALVRHPFYRARWREEMQRQADLYSSQGINEFNEAQINAMNQVAKKWALRQTNETLYTITRLSTPAHMFKFVMPFFPAWASAMRFWALKLPARRPENIARYAMAYNAPESAGWVYDDNGNKVPAQGNLLGKTADKLFGGSEGQILIQVHNPELRKRIASITGGPTDITIPKGGLDFLLQGESFWIPGVAPIVAIPGSWLAAQMPDVATALETGNLKEIPFFGDLIPEGVNEFVSSRKLTRPIYNAIVPFGNPTQEKDLIDVVTSYLAPAALDKTITGLRGMNSAEFANAAKEIHRGNMTDWDLGGRQGPEPEFFDAVEGAKKLYGFRTAMNLVMPFPTRFQTRYQFYIDEARRIDRETYASGGTFDDANKQFLNLYGPNFFRYTQSLSAGASGMSATVGEFREFKRDPRLMADLAMIGPDASYITMATRPFAKAMSEDGFDAAVYSWQMNRMIDGTLNRYLRGGQQTELPETRAERELGWMYFSDNADKLDALAASRGTTVAEDETLQALKKDMVSRLGAKYPDWYDDYNNKGGNRYLESNTALQAMVDSGYFETYKDLPYAKALFNFYNGRKDFVTLLTYQASNGGSANIDAKANAPIRLMYDQWIEKLKLSDPSGNFTNTWERFFSSDPLKLIPALKDSNG
jgi:hypothetical protein